MGQKLWVCLQIMIVVHLVRPHTGPETLCLPKDNDCFAFNQAPTGPETLCLPKDNDT